MRISVENTRFRVHDVDLDIIANVGTLQLFSKVVSNSSWTRDVAMSNREFDAREAAGVGFVSSVWKSKTEAVAEGLRLAEVIAGRSPSSVLTAKQTLLHSRSSYAEDGRPSRYALG